MFINRTGRRRLTPAALIAVPLLALSLAACAPSGNSEPQPKGGGSSQKDGEELSAMMTWQLDFAECMREQGVDYADPKEMGGGMTSSSAMGGDAAAMEAASATCSEKLGDPPALSPEEKKTVDGKVLEWARDAAECYREHGYDVPDPDSVKTMTFPADAPPEVAEECGGGAVTRPVQ